MEPSENHLWERRKAAVKRLARIDTKSLTSAQVDAGLPAAREFRDSNRKLLQALRSRTAKN